MIWGVSSLCCITNSRERFLFQGLSKAPSTITLNHFLFFVYLPPSKHCLYPRDYFLSANRIPDLAQVSAQIACIKSRVKHFQDVSGRVSSPCLMLTVADSYWLLILCLIKYTPCCLGTAICIPGSSILHSLSGQLSSYCLYFSHRVAPALSTLTLSGKADCHLTFFMKNSHNSKIKNQPILLPLNSVLRLANVFIL